MAFRSQDRSAPAHRHRVTIKEVAAKAGVSVATISRVLNGKGPVREETHKRVFDAAQELRYVPHGVARSLSMRRSNTVGLLLPDLHGEFFSEVIRGIDRAARGRGYHLLVSGFHSDQQEMAAVFSAVRGRVDGLIVLSPERDGSALRAASPGGIPLVLLNGLDDGTDVITIDNYGGARAMVEHLASLGHRRIIFIRGPEENADAIERLRGYRDAMTAAAGEADRKLELPGDFGEEAGYAAGKAAAAMNPRPTAIFAANDAMAIGALLALREEGVTVPDEVALAGFDDIPVARYVTPPLTTVSVEISELGHRALERLLHLVESETPQEGGHRDTLPTTLVIRESCGARQAEKRGQRSS